MQIQSYFDTKVCINYDVFSVFQTLMNKFFKIKKREDNIHSWKIYRLWKGLKIASLYKHNYYRKSDMISWNLNEDASFIYEF